MLDFFLLVEIVSLIFGRRWSDVSEVIAPPPSPTFDDNSGIRCAAMTASAADVKKVLPSGEISNDSMG